jgi:hypothetical protein
MRLPMIELGRIKLKIARGTQAPAYDKMKKLPPEPSEQPTSVKTSSSETLKFSKKRLVLAFAIAAVSDAIGAFATPLPPMVWVVDIQRYCSSWSWAANGCCCRDWLWRRFRDWGCFHFGCWWLGPSLSLALLGRSLNATELLCRKAAR